MDSIDDVESQRLLRLLDDAIHGARRSRREIERSLGLGQGYLGSLFRGRIELKVWHVYRLARELKLDPLTFFFAVSPPENARWVLEALGLDPEKILKDGKPADEPPPATAEPVKVEAQEAPEKKDEVPLITTKQVEEIVKKALREELNRRGVPDPEEPAA